MMMELIHCGFKAKLESITLAKETYAIRKGVCSTVPPKELHLVEE